MARRTKPRIERQVEAEREQVPDVGSLTDSQRELISLIRNQARSKVMICGTGGCGLQDIGEQQS